MTKFKEIYNRFLGKITDDLYMELTPEDTIKDLRSLLLNNVADFEFPRFSIIDYKIQQIDKLESEVKDEDFVIGVLWDDDMEDEEFTSPKVVIEDSYFEADLTSEEIEILAILMMQGWLQRQITSIETTRMKYSGSDFKMTSQANHLSKLLNLSNECHRQSHHLQRLYKRRRLEDNKHYVSNWDVFHQTRKWNT